MRTTERYTPRLLQHMAFITVKFAISKLSEMRIYLAKNKCTKYDRFTRECRLLRILQGAAEPVLVLPLRRLRDRLDRGKLQR